MKATTQMKAIFCFGMYIGILIGILIGIVISIHCLTR